MLTFIIIKYCHPKTSQSNIDNPFPINQKNYLSYTEYPEKTTIKHQERVAIDKKSKCEFNE